MACSQCLEQTYTFPLISWNCSNASSFSFPYSTQSFSDAAAGTDLSNSLVILKSKRTNNFNQYYRWKISNIIRPANNFFRGCSSKPILGKSERCYLSGPCILSCNSASYFGLICLAKLTVHHILVIFFLQNWSTSYFGPILCSWKTIATIPCKFVHLQ